MTDYIALQNKQSGRQKRRISYFVFPLLFFGGVYLLHKKNGRRKGDATTVNKKKVELKYNSFYVIFNLSFFENKFVYISPLFSSVRKA